MRRHIGTTRRVLAHKKVAKLENLAILVLTIVALTLLYFIYQKYVTLSTKSAAGGASPNITAAPKVPNGSTAQTEPNAGYLTPEEQEALKTPNPDDPADIKQAFHGKVVKAAKETKEIDISNCQPKPPVAKVAYGTEFTFKNSGPNAHTVAFSPDKKYTVRPNSSVIVKAEFSIGQGIHGYGCDQSPSALGLILAE